jgi:hypothetical protein
VDRVRDGSRHEQQYAAGALWYLANKNTTNKEELVAARGIPSLAALLRSVYTDMHKGFAARILTILATNNNANKLQIRLVGAIPPLVGLLRNGTPVTKRMATEALVELAVDHVGNQESIAAAGAIPILVRCVRMVRTDQAQARRAVCALSTLALDNDDNKARIMAAGGIRKLVAFVRHVPSLDKNVAIAALANLAKSNAAGTYLQQQEMAAIALAKLVVKDDADPETVAAAGGISPLVHLAHSGTETHNRKAAHALWSLASSSAALDLAIEAAGGIPHAFFAALAHDQTP